MGRLSSVGKLSSGTSSAEFVFGGSIPLGNGGGYARRNVSSSAGGNGFRFYPECWTPNLARLVTQDLR